jgi:trigger factor
VHLAGEPVAPADAGKAPESLQNVSVEIGAPANPPGFDDNLAGLASGDHKEFTVTYPADYSVAELAGATVDYAVTVKGIRRKELPPLDDDFAKQISEVDTLEALRERVRHDLQHDAEHEAEHAMRHELLATLGARLKGDVPAVLVDDEVERRLEEFLRRLIGQGIDPTKANINWDELRERQRPSADASVRSTLVLDEIARREGIDATDEDLDQEIARFAERAGRTPPAVRARLEKEGGLDRVRSGIRREKTMNWLIERAVVSS